jgi:hypothetical protein
MTTISPELALIDPQLAAAARALLPDPGQFRPASDRQAHAGLRITVPRKPLQTPPTTGRTHRAKRATAVCVLAATAIAAGALGLMASKWDRAAAQPSARNAPPRSLLQARAARHARIARTYTWPAVPGADSYQIKIMRGQRPVFEATTRKPALQLPAELHLHPGRYTWTATPQLNNASLSPTARPVIEETFRVGPPS